MAAGIALSGIAALALAATLDADVGLGAEGRGTRFSPAGAPATSMAAVSTIPRAALTLDASSLRLTASYAATLWTSDVGAQQSPLVNHAVDARLELKPDAPWRLFAGASALRGETDPLATSALAAAAAGQQLVSTGPIPYQWLRADARGELDLDPRTTFTGGARWNGSEVLRGELRALLPPQRGAGFDTGLSRGVTERDTLGLVASGDWSETRAAQGITTGASAAVEATWRRLLTPSLEGWLRAGTALAYTDEPITRARRDLLPVAGAGLVRGTDERLSGDLSARVTTFLDRFSGDVRPVVDLRTSVRWLIAPSLATSAQGSGGRSLDGETTFASADARLEWAVRPGMALQGGVLWRLQREARPELPSFSEAGVFVGLQYTTERR